MKGEILAESAVRYGVDITKLNKSVGESRRDN
jgi:hypothetical protein